jgi:hypothetical protein
MIEKGPRFYATFACIERGSYAGSARSLNCGRPSKDKGLVGGSLERARNLSGMQNGKLGNWRARRRFASERCGFLRSWNAVLSDDFGVLQSLQSHDVFQCGDNGYSSPLQPRSGPCVERPIPASRSSRDRVARCQMVFPRLVRVRRAQRCDLNIWVAS